MYYKLFLLLLLLLPLKLLIYFLFSDPNQRVLANLRCGCLYLCLCVCACVRMCMCVCVCVCVCLRARLLGMIYDPSVAFRNHNRRRRWLNWSGCPRPEGSRLFENVEESILPYAARRLLCTLNQGFPFAKAGVFCRQAFLLSAFPACTAKRPQQNGGRCIFKHN